MLAEMRCRFVAWASLFVTASASAQAPLGPVEAPPAPSASVATKPAAMAPPAVPTYWVLMVTGEKDGVPWMKTSTPETLGGTVKDTGAWSCRYPATLRGTEEGVSFEQMELACAVGEAEVFVNLRCNFRAKPKPGKATGKVWKRSELQTLNLRRKGEPRSTLTVSLRCDVDAAFAAD